MSLSRKASSVGDFPEHFTVDGGLEKVEGGKYEELAKSFCPTKNHRSGLWNHRAAFACGVLSHQVTGMPGSAATSPGVALGGQLWVCREHSTCLVGLVFWNKNSVLQVPL